jgi:hypothetical protein
MRLAFQANFEYVVVLPIRLDWSVAAGVAPVVGAEPSGSFHPGLDRKRRNSRVLRPVRAARRRTSPMRWRSRRASGCSVGCEPCQNLGASGRREAMPTSGAYTRNSALVRFGFAPSPVRPWADTLSPRARADLVECRRVQIRRYTLPNCSSQAAYPLTWISPFDTSTVPAAQT